MALVKTSTQIELSSSNSTSVQLMLKPWDVIQERDDSTASVITDIAVYIISGLALLIYLPTCYIICSQNTMWSRTAFRLLLVQDIYQILNLILLTLPLAVDLSPSGHTLTTVSYVMAEISEILYYASIYSHTMIAGNRFVAVVFYKHYLTLFTPRFTTGYILLFLLLPIIQREVLTVVGVRICLLTRFGFIISAPSQQVMDAYISTDMVSTFTIIILLVTSYTITIYKLRRVLQRRRRFKNVPSSQSLQEEASSDSNNVLDSREIRLTIYFIIMTVVLVATSMFWLLKYFRVIPTSWNLYIVLNALNFSTNSFTTMMVCQEIRSSFIKMVTPWRR